MPSKRPPIEILAPAGDEEMMRAAVFSGADCVYLGFRGWNARRGAENFDEESLVDAVAFCHARGCRVYLALNTLVLPGREAEFGRALRAAWEAGCDAAIVQDLAAVPLAKTWAPGLALHASTQMSVHSLAGVRQLAEWGFTRAILARELREEEIAEIARHSPIELEAFVHGALCFSVSGQCYFSAFLGGRSGNRGGCAGPCRLPYRREGREEYAFSLKDLSILRALPRLAEMGVVSAKIEGRLRGPEYCAAVVDAARKARDGLPYEEELLLELFSRGEFTGGWYEGGTGREMLGRRTEEDAARAKKAMAKARELYRREKPRVPVQMRLELAKDGGRLRVSDGLRVVEKNLPGPLCEAKEDQTAALTRALEKTGGTPFYLETQAEVAAGGFYAPAGAVSALRRQALEELLALRGMPEAPVRPEKTALPPPALFAAPKGRQRKIAGLRGRFASVEALPPQAAVLCEELLLPLCQAKQVPEGLRAKTRLELPRFLPGQAEKKAEEQILAASAMGFLGFEASNLAHLTLCRGLPHSGGFGLNIANAAAATLLEKEGCAALTPSWELSLNQMRKLAADCPPDLRLDAVAYGHLPLMLSRACPFKAAKEAPGPDGRTCPDGCKTCKGGGELDDRTGRRFWMDCQDGMRQLYNPVPLWMADRLDDLPADLATLYFTNETPQQAQAVLHAFVAGQPAQGDFTRGLYGRGTED